MGHMSNTTSEQGLQKNGLFRLHHQPLKFWCPMLQYGQAGSWVGEYMQLS